MGVSILWHRPIAALSTVLPQPSRLGGASGKAVVAHPPTGKAPQSGLQRLELNHESSVAQNGQLLRLLSYSWPSSYNRVSKVSKVSSAADPPPNISSVSHPASDLSVALIIKGQFVSSATSVQFIVSVGAWFC